MDRNYAVKVTTPALYKQIADQAILMWHELCLNKSSFLMNVVISMELL